MREYRTRHGEPLTGSLGHLVDGLPYQWQPVVQVTQHGRDLWHRHAWLELQGLCGHNREHMGGPVPDKFRCYQCGREGRNG